MRNFLFFDKFIIPQLITYLYWISCAFSILGGLAMILSGTLQGLFAGIVTAVLGVLGARISCEVIMVVFKINENLQKVVDSKKNQEQ